MNLSATVFTFRHAKYRPAYLLPRPPSCSRTRRRTTTPSRLSRRRSPRTPFQCNVARAGKTAIHSVSYRGVTATPTQNPSFLDYYKVWPDQGVYNYVHQVESLNGRLICAWKDRPRLSFPLRQRPPLHPRFPRDSLNTRHSHRRQGMQIVRGDAIFTVKGWVNLTLIWHQLNYHATTKTLIYTNQ